MDIRTLDGRFDGSGPDPSGKTADGLAGGLFTSNSDEWYTPRDIVDRVVALLGAVDLDPCSNSHDQPIMPAARHYTASDDGLGQPWRGRVYMNPPYGREIEKWVRKLVAEYDAGHVTEGIALLPARTDTVWFQLLRSRPVCLVRGRLKFSDCPTAAPFPSALVYFGTRAEGFRRAFADIGDTWERSQQAMDHPSQPPAGTRSSRGDPPKSGTDYERLSTEDGVGNSLDELALELFPGSRFLEEGP